MKYLSVALCLSGSLVAQGGLLESFYQKKQETRAQTIDTIKWQNTLLTSPKYPVGVYKNDLVNTGFFASFIAADMLLYNQLMKWSVGKTMQAITHDLDGLIAILERTRAAESRFEERMAFAAYQGDTAISIAAKKRILANPLRRYLDTHHKLDSLLSKKTLSALGLRWAWDRVSCWLEREMVVPPPSLITQLLGVELDNELRLAHEQAFQGDNLEPAAKAPYSATTAVKILAFTVSPFIALRASLRTGHISFGLHNLGLFNRFLRTGLPEWLFSQGAQTLLELIELGGAVSFFAQSNRYQWINYVVQHRYELLRLLYVYRHVLEDPAGEEAQVKRIEQEIRDFVKRGYTHTSMLSGVSVRHWWSSQEQSTTTISDWLGYATLAIFALKSAHLIRNSVE